ncbi:hypothetical protein 2050H1_022 [Serratia phage 2050H1]|uniref:Uncharacterized protein n=1 Tax=Serratia phage 2050H1 TaxID=2024250 RepID=A0A249Y272_9CAUD|nr:hypothetical protein 2050H1_022 [Serratia phage 2050H1]
MNNMPTTRTALEIDDRFVVEASANSMGCYIYSLYVNGYYVSCLGIDGMPNQEGGFDRYTKKQAIEDANQFAAPIMKRISEGKPYKNGERGQATQFLLN